MQSTMKHEIALLDFLRGWAALLVFFHHAAILGGGPGFLSGSIGKEAVNAFMLASGFLIYFQCNVSKSYFGLKNTVGLKNFYIRRIFRIAPAYYFCLVIALIFASYLGASRELIAEVLPHTMTDMSRYYIQDPLKSFFIHASFIFGLMPSYSFSTPLPDWSLGLEMQFYLVFPVLFYFLKKNFTVFFTVSLLGMMGIAYVSYKLGFIFPMPSYLPLKFHNFAAGIALAYLFINNSERSKSYYFVIVISIVFLLLGNRSLYIPVLFLFSWWWLCNIKRVNIMYSFVNRIFSHSSSKYLAEMSYSLYIFHLILMLPFFSFVLKGGELSTLIWIASSLSLLILTMLVAHFIYKYIEIPGINYGKKLINKKA
ncbi:acyltransferase family protein [Shewanella japonica]|uniref:Acyltransferase 3 n=1 Tax=Shewanella japonica TaxID=93973 RepID=A0ABN4YIF4_9GAMM|nr:acyltransferase [Shewanella japonica]ARD22972.1 Acyltransferase 3 [Shewanella japonica]